MFFIEIRCYRNKSHYTIPKRLHVLFQKLTVSLEIITLPTYGHVYVYQLCLETSSVVVTCYICFRELFWVRNDDDRFLIAVVKVISNLKQLATFYYNFKYIEDYMLLFFPAVSISYPLPFLYIHIFLNISLSLIHFLKWDVCYKKTIIPCQTHSLLLCMNFQFPPVDETTPHSLLSITMYSVQINTIIAFFYFIKTEISRGIFYHNC